MNKCSYVSENERGDNMINIEDKVEHRDEHEKACCGCNSDNSSKHTHHENCECHEEHHNHEHHEGCCCHDHHEHGNYHKHHEEAKPAEGMIRKVYIVENLGCANCAAKMERNINALDEVESATITFSTKLLSVTAPKEIDWTTLQDRLQKICQAIESEVTLTERPERRRNQASNENIHRHEKGEKGRLILLVICAIVFIGIEIYHEVFGAEEPALPLIIVLAIVYLLLGNNVLITAFKNILHGQIFDENFLMSIATLGAFAIGEYPEAVGVMLFYRVGELFEELAVEKSRSQIMDTLDLRPEIAVRVCEDNVENIAAEDIAVGDILLVRPGDRIPVDGVVVEGSSRIDTSAVTGEPVLVSVEPGTEVTSGCVNTSGTIQIRAEKELADSMVSRILDSVENAVASKPKIDKFITRFSRIYTPIVVLTSLFTAVVMPLIKGEAFYPYIYTALTFLVMSCPCALVLSVPLAFFCGIGASSKKGILFKGGVVLEALTKIKAVVMDKTGTITEGNFVVQKINATEDFDEAELLKTAASAEAVSTHPIAISIVSRAKEEKVEYKLAENVSELAGKGIKAILEDGREILCGNREFLVDSGVVVNMKGNAEATIGTEVYIAINGVFAGNIVIADTIKKDSKDAVRAIKSLGIKSAMLTGDAWDNANGVALETGVDEVHAKLLPDDKLNKLREIRAQYGEVMFVGDGINDAPVLAGADVGAAMGNGSDAALEASDVVFLHSNLSAVPEAIAVAKKTMRIAKQNVIFALAIKIAVMVLGLTGIYSNMWLAVFADTGVAFLCILNSVRALRMK